MHPINNHMKMKHPRRIWAYFRYYYYKIVVNSKNDSEIGKKSFP